MPMRTFGVCKQEEERPMTHQESQAKWLQDASNLVKRNAFFMKRALVTISTSCNELVHLKG